ncbi:putative integral membrane protein [Pseudarthrobacter chlorophenolicus A6]|uniref:Integral membrane protein n=1 Tax=Pseudarthrobacter chlorophenolicus (strain ATCC 700700 / DSM 12829 / CIP 107037 / JCM 12360 / KCTC 9906 / NCIMB 13794 / A6) TaxID=452863 RepID=B8HBX9_PSECP|nr:hypothetical protein [Pseudarthrobacter chlorophenolicus]ACL38689.1 putative integral membrane protein [Pseudarthrobacter chlorophenolicus A6]SDQ43648.1 hypothetical protein SAMN04489738_0837 [Pseudarthrobacter chlorophenolicus]
MDPSGSPGAGDDADDDGGGTAGPAFRAALLSAVVAWRVSIVSLRFWAVAVGAACAAWAFAAGLVWLMAGAEGDQAGLLPAALLVYVFASSLLPAAAALVGMHWGMSWQLRQASAGEHHSGYLASVLATAMQGLVFALLVLVSLLIQAVAAGGPGSVAVTAAGLAAVEGILFGAMGVAGAALVGRPVLVGVAGWALGLFLVVGTPVAGALLVPAVRSEEPVTVALNVHRDADGTPVAYECSQVPAGTVEVYRTERIMWVPAVSPIVVLMMLTGEPGPGQELPGLLSEELQTAADGTGVPCVNGEPRSMDSPRTPLAAAGLLLQAGLAGALLGGAHVAASRRRPPA